MPWIHFAKKHRPSIEVPVGANLMKSLLDAQIPVASSCHGDGVCAKCRLNVEKGVENLSAENEVEMFLKEKFQMKPLQRISCQTSVLGDVEIHATYW